MTLPLEHKSSPASQVPPSEEKPQLNIEELQLGIWHLKIDHGRYLDGWDDIRTNAPLILRICQDIYGIAPGLFVVYVLTEIWQSMQDTLQMYFSSRLLRAVEAGLVRGEVDRTEVITAIIARVLCSMLVAGVSWHGRRTLEYMRSKVLRHYEIALMRAKLRVDLPTSQDPTSHHEATASSAWSSLQQIFSLFASLSRLASQMMLMTHLSWSTGGPVMLFLAICQPFVRGFDRGLYSKVCLGIITDENYKRVKALEAFANGTYRQDIISNGLENWIVDESEKAHGKLGYVLDNSPATLYKLGKSPAMEIWKNAVGDLPMIYCAVMALLRPGEFSIASWAILQQTAYILHGSFAMIAHHSQMFRENLNTIKALYDSQTTVNSMITGNVAYPRQDDSSCEKGMAFELRNVSFAYPGSQKKEDALKDISLQISPGEVVVIVGENGSGKTTLIRLLSRLYDPSSGALEINGLRSRDYRIGGLHKATVLLSQDNQIYPLSMAENIGLGCPELCDDLEMIEAAAKAGGAWQFLQKLKDGIRTELQPAVRPFQSGVRSHRDHPFFQELRSLRKPIDISGGEKQRLVAARSFMRFNSGNVKFVAVDEPSSALDADAELKLFEGLINVREGKTVVFVTHRFGHLTKYADKIICMKDGLIVEIGTHDELLYKRGEYAKLYDIQAKAFA